MAKQYMPINIEEKLVQCVIVTIRPVVFGKVSVNWFNFIDYLVQIGAVIEYREVNHQVITGAKWREVINYVC